MGLVAKNAHCRAGHDAVAGAFFSDLPANRGEDAGMAANDMHLQCGIAVFEHVLTLVRVFLAVTGASSGPAPAVSI